MKPTKFFATILASFFLIPCHSQTRSNDKSVLGVFEATTPCTDAAKDLLEIPVDLKCEMMKWNLTLYQDPKTLAPTNFKLSYQWGLAKPRSKDIAEGGSSKELNGKWVIAKGVDENPNEIVYKLIDDNSKSSISFQKLDENLLHLLDKQDHLMIGTAAWSYTLNRIDPIAVPTTKFTSKSKPPESTQFSSPVEISFTGRTPCNEALLAINNISAHGCQGIKCKVTLYFDPQTHVPTSFRIQTIYVGNGDDTKYSITGKCETVNGTTTDPDAIVYQLTPDKFQKPILFQKAGNTILMLDENRNLMVGNSYLSYTLNADKK